MTTSADCKAFLATTLPAPPDGATWKRTAKRQDPDGGWVRTFSDGTRDAVVRQSPLGALSLVGGDGAAASPLIQAVFVPPTRAVAPFEWLFAVAEGDEYLDDLVEDGGSCFIVALVSRTHWDAKGCLSDEHIGDAVAAEMGEAAMEGLDELMESVFSFVPEDPGLDLAGARAELLRRGFVEDLAFVQFIDSSDM